MLERGANSWFYSCETRAEREKKRRNQWLSEILMRYKEQMLKDFRLGRVLPYLVYDGVFSLKEYREILSQDCYPERVDCFLLRLFSKGPGAFCAFCSHLEEFSPYLLTLLFLYYQEQTQRILQDVLVAEEAARVGAQRDPSNDSVTQEQGQGAWLFHKYKLPERKDFHKVRIENSPYNGPLCSLIFQSMKCDAKEDISDAHTLLTLCKPPSMCEAMCCPYFPELNIGTRGTGADPHCSTDDKRQASRSPSKRASSLLRD